MPGPASRLAREISAETMSASSGSVNARRRNNRGTLEQVNEGDDSTDSRGEGEEESRSLTRRNDRVRTNSRLERGSVKSREISVRRGSVVSQRHEQSSTRPGAKYFCKLMPNIFVLTQDLVSPEEERTIVLRTGSPPHPRSLEMKRIKTFILWATIVPPPIIMVAIPVIKL